MALAAAGQQEYETRSELRLAIASDGSSIALGGGGGGGGGVRYKVLSNTGNIF